MKTAHRRDVFAYSRFDEARNLDFHGWVWTGPHGGVLFDPLPMSEHDAKHLRTLGGASVIVITNSDHVRAAPDLARTLGAKLMAPKAEQGTLDIACDRWLDDGDEVVPGLVARTLDGSKTPGELCLVLEQTTLFTGDLLRSHEGGRLNLLPEPKLKDPRAALASVERVLELYPHLDAVLVGDGWPIFRDGAARLEDLCRSLRAATPQ